MPCYRSTPIAECHESLVRIPAAAFARTGPHSYVALGTPQHGAAAPALRAAHACRELLNQLMRDTGVSRHANAWRHFSRGDRMAALANNEPRTVYGRAA